MKNKVLIRQLLLAAIAVVAVLYFHSLYWTVARLQSAVNDDFLRVDQRAYMIFAISAYETNFHFTGGRNRMPIYPFMQALFYTPNLPREAYFELGKQVNIILSTLSLFLLGAAFFRRFSKIFAIYAVLCIAFVSFAFKAPYFQAEILFYTVFALAFILSVEALSAPRLYKSAGVGILYALAHLTKASALPGIVLFVFCHVLMTIFLLLRRTKSREVLFKHVLFALTPVLSFCAVLFPYFSESHERYGSFLYNVNTTFYVWYDSWDEAKAGTRAAGDRQGWPDLPDDQIPSMGKYLREHSGQEILKRFRSGIGRLIGYGCYFKNSKHSFGYCSQIGLNLIVLSICTGILAVNCPWRQLRRRLHVYGFMALFLCVYGLAFAWYMPLIGSGNRTILSLLIPFLWTVGIVVHSPQITLPRVTLIKWRPRAITIVYVLILITLAYEIRQVVDFRAITMFGGE